MRATLAAVLLAGAALRVYHLGHESLWLDEAFSIEIAKTSLHHIVAETSLDVHPPLYYFALHYWRALGGDSEAGSRLLSALLSFAGVLAAGGVAWRLFDGPTALATVVLLALSRFQVQYAQEARMYALLALLATLSTWAFLRLVERGRAGPFVLYVAVTCAMTYTHIYSAFVITGQALTLVWLFVIGRDRAAVARAAGRWIAAVVLVGVAFLPWLPILLRQATAVEQGFWIPERAWYRLFEPVLTYAGSVPLVCLLAPLAIYGAVRVWRAAPIEPALPPRAVLMPWLAAPIVLPFLLSRIGSPIFLPKYTIPASIPFAMLAARGLVSLPRLAWRAVAWTLVIALTYPAFVDYYTVPRKEGWRDALQALQAEARPTDLVLLHQPFNLWPFDYYWHRKDIMVRAFPLSGPTPAPDVLASIAREAAGHYDRVWYVTTWSDPASTAIADALGRSLHEVTMHLSTGVETYLFVRKP